MNINRSKKLTKSAFEATLNEKIRESLNLTTDKVLELNYETRRVFLKYYTDSGNHLIHFWGEQDRKAYLNAMIGIDGLLLKYIIQTPKVS